jgi:peptidoglycan/xylan/chitin deacetylase (PgdA/CDA1 family)
MTAILIYHDVVEDARRDSVGFPGPLAARYKHSPELFERHLAAIAATGLEVGLVGAGDSPQAALTFDDGGAGSLEAATMLERRGWRGHFFITTGRLGTPGFLTAEGARELAARGHGVGSHSHTHPTYMGKLSRNEIQYEWDASRDRLAEVLGEPPASAAVPGGFLSSVVTECAAKAGYTTLMTSEPVRKVRFFSGVQVVGRYTIWSSTPPAIAAAYLRGSAGARARLWAEWRLKGAAKRISPQAYDALRRIRA